MYALRAIFYIIARIAYNYNMNCYEFLKANLKLLREQNNETQRQVADNTKIPRANLARYETGENVPPLDVLIILADYYGTTVDDLLH